MMTRERVQVRGIEQGIEQDSEHGFDDSEIFPRIYRKIRNASSVLTAAIAHDFEDLFPRTSL